MGCMLVKLARVNSSFFLQHYFFFKLIFFISSFDIRFLGLELCGSFVFFFYAELFWFHISDHIIVKLTQVGLGYHRLNNIFYFKKI